MSAKKTVRRFWALEKCDTGSIHGSWPTRKGPDKIAKVLNEDVDCYTVVRVTITYPPNRKGAKR